MFPLPAGEGKGNIAWLGGWGSLTPASSLREREIEWR